MAARLGHCLLVHAYLMPCSRAQGVGKRETFLYNLPEVATTHAVLGAPNVSARFGTSPGVWNGAMALMARMLPRETLQNRDAALAMVRAVEPLVRAVQRRRGDQPVHSQAAVRRRGTLRGRVCARPAGAPSGWGNARRRVLPGGGGRARRCRRFAQARRHGHIKLPGKSRVLAAREQDNSAGIWPLLGLAGVADVALYSTSNVAPYLPPRATK